jgi:predicted ribosomally synthesized peptide with nif11-like leader
LGDRQITSLFLNYFKERIMSLQNVQAFYQRLAEDEAFRNQIQNVNSKEECSQIVKAAGYEFSQEEYEEYTIQLLESDPADSDLKDLSEQELEAVFGGATSFIRTRPPIEMMYGLPPTSSI